MSAGWLDAAGFQALLDPKVISGKTLAQLRRSGTIFGIWFAEKAAYFYPPWQLDSAGTPSPALAELLALLRGSYGVASGEPTSGWEEMEWLVSPHALLDGGVPADMLVTASDRVLDVAKQDFSSWSADARW